MDEEDVKTEDLTPEVKPIEDVDKEQELNPAITESTGPSGDGTRGKIIAIIGEMDPGADFTNESIFLESVLNALTSYKSVQDRLKESVEEFPEFGDMLAGVLKGMDPNEAIARYYDVENMAPPEGDPQFDKYNTAKAERRSGIDAMNTRKKQLEDNQQVSVDNVRKFMEAKGWDQQTAIEFLGKLEEIEADLFDGKLSDAHLSVFEKGLGYDNMVAEKDKEKELAIEDARIAGKNEGIKERRSKQETGDGLPKLANSASVADTTIPAKDKFTTELEQVANKKRII